MTASDPTLPPRGPSFAMSRRGGAMFAGCGLALIVMIGAGSAMTNYAWREAQREEVDAALRAASSIAGKLLVGASDSATRQRVQQRMVGFLRGTIPGLNLADQGVTVNYDAQTGAATLAIADGTYVLYNVWGGAGDTVAFGVDENPSVTVKAVTERYEVAIALDVSPSMGTSISGGGVNPSQIVKIDALKSAMDVVVDATKNATGTKLGGVMVSLVPFSSAVNVADTATDGPAVDKKRTPAKERYLRMLAGAPASGETLADTRRDARQAVQGGGGHWVDLYHHYGIGNDLGVLRKQSLPAALLDDTDWDLRKDTSLDVSAQVPALDKWRVNGADFWNGCVMARWGAYWHPNAGRTAVEYPVRQAVARWSAGATPLKATATPLHLSDAPPVAGNPHTLFTAYSWPDARASGAADHRLQTVMARLLEAPDQPTVGYRLRSRFGNSDPEDLKDFETVTDNDWSSRGSKRGATLCPEDSILPLTADWNEIERVVDNLKVGCLFPDCQGSATRTSTAATHVHLGVVWGLRTLSPLWRRVWQLPALVGERPGLTCAPGEAGGICDARLRKSILLITDGANDPGSTALTRLAKPAGDRNPEWQDSRPLTCSRNFLQAYHAAAFEDDPAGFNGRFSAYLDRGRFGGAGMETVLDAFRAHDTLPDQPSVRDARKAVLENLTPWNLFRGLDADAMDQLMDGRNRFGFDRRPAQTEHFCRMSSVYTAYGRVDDRIYAGESATLPSVPLPPVEDEAPFAISGISGSDLLGSAGVADRILHQMLNRLDGWFNDSCRIAGARGVRIRAVFVGDSSTETRRRAIAELSRCIRAAGGDPDRDLLIAPDAQRINEAFSEIFAFRTHNLQFLD